MLLLEVLLLQQKTQCEPVEYLRSRQFHYDYSHPTPTKGHMIYAGVG